MQAERADGCDSFGFPGSDRPSVNRQVIGSSPIAGASLMASDLRECMSSDGVPAGLTGFRLWGFVGILVRRPGFWSSSFVGRAVRMVSQSGGSEGQRSSRRHKWPGRCRDGFTPRRTVVLTWRLRGAAVVEAGVSGCIARTCRAVPGRSLGQGRRATRLWAGRREVAEACRSAEHGARIAGPGPGACTGAASALGGGCRTGLHGCCRAQSSLGSRVIALAAAGGPLPDGGSSASRTCGVTLDHVA